MIYPNLPDKGQTSFKKQQFVYRTNCCFLLVAPRRRDVSGDRERSQVAFGNAESLYYMIWRAFARYARADLALFRSILRFYSQKSTPKGVLFVVAPRRIELRIQP